MHPLASSSGHRCLRLPFRQTPIAAVSFFYCCLEPTPLSLSPPILLPFSPWRGRCLASSSSSAASSFLPPWLQSCFLFLGFASFFSRSAALLPFPPRPLSCFLFLRSPRLASFSFVLLLFSRGSGLMASCPPLAPGPPPPWSPPPPLSLFLRSRSRRSEGNEKCHKCRSSFHTRATVRRDEKACCPPFLLSAVCCGCRSCGCLGLPLLPPPPFRSPPGV